MLYAYELHCHTSETSRCGKCSAAEMVEAYARKGFAGVVITDHFVNGYSFSAFPRTWKEKMDAFVKGYLAARETGEKLGIKAYFGFEYTNQGNNGEDYLILGLQPEKLYTDLVDCDQWPIEDVVERVHTLGGIVIRAHPYREDDYIAESCVMRPGLNIDAVEVFNGGNKQEIYNLRAYDMALREGKAMVAGSDTHHVSTTASDYIAFEEDPPTYAALCQAIREGRATLIHRLLRGQ